ncbi:MAG: hypothetical protein EON58_16500 [Alphaproteobacteria bacterium]|nr:MAG: hypothetical protein EON58_16500 [Alphaproteobacteria bacterium]
MTNYLNDNEEPDLSEPALEFGARIIERLEAIQEDIEHEGAQGLVSLIAATIKRYGFSHDQLLQFGKRLCPPGYFGAFSEILSTFRGDDRKRHLWRVQTDGSYALVA